MKCPFCGLDKWDGTPLSEEDMELHLLREKNQDEKHTGVSYIQMLIKLLAEPTTE